MLCICAPDTAIAAPARIAVNILGSLSFQMTVGSERPVSPMEMSAKPRTINMMIPIEMQYVNLFLDSIGKIIGQLVCKVRKFRELYVNLRVVIL